MGSQTDTDDHFPEPTELEADQSVKDLKPGITYISTVENIAEYGVFVSVGPKSNEVSGLVHTSNLPPMTTLGDYSHGDTLIVELEEIKHNGDIAFNGLKAPEIAPDAPQESVTPTTDLQNEITERLSHIENQLEDMAGEPDSDSDSDSDSELGIVNNPVDEIKSKLTALEQDGYEVIENNIHTRNKGDEVTIEISLSVGGDL